MPKRSSGHIAENLKKSITSSYSILSAMLTRITDRISEGLKKLIILLWNGLVKTIKLLGRNWLAWIMLLLTVVLVTLSACDIPNYPLSGYKAIPTETRSYINTDFGDHMTYEIDYTIKYSKLTHSKPYSKLIGPKSYNVSIDLPTDVFGFIVNRDVNELRGMRIKGVNASNHTVTIENIDKINPILLSIKYTSGKEIIPEDLVREKALLDIQNDSIMLDSFYLKVKNVCDHDIKTLGHNLNVSDLINRDLPELKNTSWTNQRVMIYDRGLPVGTGEIDGKGNLTWAINSIKPHEQKIYYFKKIKLV